MTCARCAELEEELAYLRSEMGLRVEGEEIDALRRRFGLARLEARLALVLAKASGVVTFAQIEEALPERQGDDLRHETCVRVYISKLRGKLGQTSIENVRGVGYRMRPDTRALVSA